MSRMTLAAQDAVRAIRQTVEASKEELKRHWSQQGRAVRYNDGRKLWRLAHEQAVPLVQLHRMATAGTPEASHRPNMEVLRAIYHLDAGQKVITAQAPRNLVLTARADLGLRVRLDWLAEVNGKRRMYWVQPRKTFTLNDRQRALMMRLLLTRTEQTDYEEFELNILDLRDVSGDQRALRIYTPGDVNLPSREEAERELNVVALAIAELRAEGWTPPRQPRTYPGQEEMRFGPG